MKRVVIFLVLLISAPPLLASDLSLVGGVSHGGSLKLGDGSKVDLRDFNLFGVRYEKDFFIVLGIENSLLFSSGPVVKLNSPETRSQSDDSGFSYRANLLINLPVAERAIPYVAVGLGFLHKSGSSTPDIGTRFLTDWGVGLKLTHLVGPGGVRLDYRRVNIHDVVDQDVTTNEISGGILFSF